MTNLTQMKTIQYTRTAMLLHWLIALFILINVTLALSVDLFPESWGRPIVNTHKSFGILVLGLFFLRLSWRLANPPPPLPTAYSLREQVLAHWVHWGFYVLLFAIPMSGWLHDSAWKAAATHPMSLFGVIPWPRIPWVMNMEPTLKEHWHSLFGAAHEWLAYVLYAMFAVHVGGAIKHELSDRESSLQRMWPWPLRRRGRD